MEDLNMHIARNFGLKPKNIIKHKLFYICNSDKGQKMIKKATEPHSHLLLQHEIKEALYANGLKVDRFYLSVTKEPFFLFQGDTYVMTDHLNYREAIFSDKNEFLNIIKTTAKMHQILKSTVIGTFAKPPTSKVSANLPLENKSYDTFLNTYQKNIGGILSLKKKIAKHRQLTDFDVAFIKNYDFYIGCISRCCQIISLPGTRVLYDNAAKNNYFCHNLLKEKFILINHADIYITNFSECGLNHYIIDLAALIKRYFRAATGTSHNILPITSLIDAYNSINPLTKDELGALYAELLFPDKFIKICNQYYTKNRTWIPGTFKTRIEVILNTKDSYMEYIGAISASGYSPPH